MRLRISVTPALVKQEAERRILAIMPDFEQRNLLASALAATQTYGASPASWPAGLQAENLAALAKWAKIKAIRAASDRIEALTPIPPDFADDLYWTEEKKA